MTTGSPWFRVTNPQEPEHGPEPVPVPPQQYAPGPGAPGRPPYDPLSDPLGDPISAPRYDETAHQASYGTTAYAPAQEPQPPHAPQETPFQGPYEATPYEAPRSAPQQPYETPYEASYETPAAPAYETYGETMALPSVDADQEPAPAEPPPAPDPGPGRAERRRAAKGKGKGRRGAAPAPAAATAPTAPLSRVEARRAARARKESVGVVASRVVGELFITFGVVMLLFVTYQLWWTNVRAGQQTDRAKEQIEDAWTKGRAPEAFEPGQGFAIMYIPKLDVVVPIAEGIDKPKVLDRGMVGHYAEGSLKTAMPSAKQGNFAVAGHRNTHGEPFRYINQLNPGDPIVVETQDAYYTYEMASILPQTSPSNVAVIDPVPQGSGFTGPGRYITLTTCTPEFTSTYRMIVWGKMVEERPRSKGKPDALVG
ncbi:class E sortase [Streptomyces sp. NPDC008121]|uniref:class E sortase n=1 Tax=Streptomyces sp. NPDC008121 TaxID=3364809 RepID=UPI0036E55B5E